MGTPSSTMSTQFSPSLDNNPSVFCCSEGGESVHEGGVGEEM